MPAKRKFSPVDEREGALDFNGVEGLSMEKLVTIQRVPIANLYENEFFEIFHEYLHNDRQRLIFFANAHTCNVAQNDVEFLEALQEADLVLPDGMGLKIAGKFMGQSIKANLNGTDLLPKILSAAANEDIKIFFLGGEPGVASDAKERLINRIPQLNIVGVRNGFFHQEECRQVIEEINASEAELLIVGLGVPLQEKWILKFKKEISATLIFGVGAFLDFSAGKFSRAPFVFRQFGLEWLFRLYQEPRRLFARYVLGNTSFLLRTVHEGVWLRRSFFLFILLKVLCFSKQYYRKHN